MLNSVGASTQPQLRLLQEKVHSTRNRSGPVQSYHHGIA